MSDELKRIYGEACVLQYRVPSGIIDAVVDGLPLALVEIKLTLSFSAFDQLARYAKCFREPVARVVIAKTCPPIGFPEPPSFLRRAEEIATLLPGLYILPLMLKGRA